MTLIHPIIRLKREKKQVEAGTDEMPAYELHAKFIGSDEG
jgi:hypothetical protein